jgi:hypothetical protein
MREVHALRLPDVAVGDRLRSTTAGAFALTPKRDWLKYVCPCGCGDENMLPIAGQRAWLWDGNEDAPTVTPSIRRLNGCHYHGHLTAGTWTFEGDSGRAP